MVAGGWWWVVGGGGGVGECVYVFVVTAFLVSCHCRRAAAVAAETEDGFTAISRTLRNHNPC